MKDVDDKEENLEENYGLLCFMCFCHVPEFDSKSFTPIQHGVCITLNNSQINQQAWGR